MRLLLAILAAAYALCLIGPHLVSRSSSGDVSNVAPYNGPKAPAPGTIEYYIAMCEALSCHDRSTGRAADFPNSIANFAISVAKEGLDDE